MQDFRKNLYQTPIYIRIANQNQFKFESELFLRSHGDGIPTHLWNWQVMIDLHFNLSLVYESLDFISGWLVINKNNCHEWNGWNYVCWIFWYHLLFLKFKYALFLFVKILSESNFHDN